MAQLYALFLQMVSWWGCKVARSSSGKCCQLPCWTWKLALECSTFLQTARFSWCVGCVLQDTLCAHIEFLSRFWVDRICHHVLTKNNPPAARKLCECVAISYRKDNYVAEQVLFFRRLMVLLTWKKNTRCIGSVAPWIVFFCYNIHLFLESKYSINILYIFEILFSGNATGIFLFVMFQIVHIHLTTPAMVWGCICVSVLKLALKVNLSQFIVHWLEHFYSYRSSSVFQRPGCIQIMAGMSCHSSWISYNNTLEYSGYTMHDC